MRISSGRRKTGHNKIVPSDPGIKDVNDFRTRKIGNNIVIDMHAKMIGLQTLYEAHNIASEAESAIRQKYGQNSIINIHKGPTDI